MSSNASLMPNRSARARALGRSLSHSARISIPFIFLRTGRWATCTTAPAPTMPTRSGSLIALAPTRPPAVLVEALQLRPGIIRRENLLIVLPRPRPSHRPPLTEAHPVPVAASVGHQPADPAARARGGQAEGGAAQNVARGGAENPAHLGPVHLDVVVLERDGELADPTRRGAHRNPDIADVPDPRGRNADDVGQRAAEDGPK